MYKTGLTFDCIELNNHAKDLMLEAKLWDDNGEPMASLVVTIWAHIGRKARRNHRGRTGGPEKNRSGSQADGNPTGFPDAMEGRPDNSRYPLQLPPSSYLTGKSNPCLKGSFCRRKCHHSWSNGLKPWRFITLRSRSRLAACSAVTPFAPYQASFPK